MELKLCFAEIEQLKRICIPKSLGELEIDVGFKIEMNEPAINYCKKIIESEKAEDITLYKKLCECKK